MSEYFESLTSRLEVFVTCKNLVSADSNPYVYAVAEIFEWENNVWKSLGVTEVQKTKEPSFAKRFLINYHFEETQKLKVCIHDSENPEKRCDATLVGGAECELTQIIHAPSQIYKAPLTCSKKKVRGEVSLQMEEMTQCKELATFLIAGEGLVKVGGCCASLKPIFFISRAMETGDYQCVYTSEENVGANPEWSECQVTMQHLCNGDYDRPIKFEVKNARQGRYLPMGSTTTTMRGIAEGGERSLDMKDDDGNSKGLLVIRDLQIKQKYSFLDYVLGGCELNLLCAVDFTSSNGAPYLHNSLHYQNPSGDYNDYEKALVSVGKILLNYDSDKMVPMYGFGGKVNNQISHCFPLNGSHESPEVYEVDGMLTTYRTALNSVALSGPTLFSHIVDTTIRYAQAARCSQDNQQYFILFILTDGEIHDMKQTIDRIVEATSLPISVIIVGVGEESFENMVVLDADDDPLIDSKGKEMERDAVQFVPFREVGNSASRLSKEVLEEVPGQLVEFFDKAGIKPNPPITDVQMTSTKNATDIVREHFTQVAMNSSGVSGATSHRGGVQGSGTGVRTQDVNLHFSQGGRMVGAGQEGYSVPTDGNLGSHRGGRPNGYAKSYGQVGSEQGRKDDYEYHDIGTARKNVAHGDKEKKEEEEEEEEEDEDDIEIADEEANEERLDTMRRG